MEVEEFAIGMGNPKWVYSKKGPTEYTFRAWPLGGFVRIKGMEPREDGSETSIEHGFYSKPPWQRFIVLAAGPIFSFLLGWLISFAMFASLGVATPTTTIDTIAEGSAATRANLKPGDTITAINGQKVNTFLESTLAIRKHPHEKIDIEYIRDGKTNVVSVVTDADSKPTPVIDADGMPTGELKPQGKLGFIPKGDVQHGLAISFFATNQRFVEIFQNLGKLVQKPKLLQESMGGPVRMARETTAAAKRGILNNIELAALLSISIGIFNLLPIPLLDGGQMLVALIEMLRSGRRISYKLQGALMGVGFSIVGLFMVFVFTKDIRQAHLDSQSGTHTETPKLVPPPSNGQNDQSKAESR